MTTKELKTLLKTLRLFGAVSYKAQGVEILLDPNFSTPVLQQATGKPISASKSNLQEQVDKLIPQLSDDDWLLATNSVDPDSEEVSN